MREQLKLTDDSHKYQQLPLISVEEFLAQHSEHQGDDEDTLMVARIDHERAEREALEQERQELLKRKQKLIADNKRRKDDLASLDNDLEKFIDVKIPTFPCVRHYLTCIVPGCETYPEAIREGALRPEQCVYLKHQNPTYSLVLPLFGDNFFSYLQKFSLFDISQNAPSSDLSGF